LIQNYTGQNDIKSSFMSKRKLRIGIALKKDDFTWIKDLLIRHNSDKYSFYQIQYDLFSKNIACKADILIWDLHDRYHHSKKAEEPEVHIPLIVLLENTENDNLLTAIGKHPYDIWIKGITAESRILHSIEKFIAQEEQMIELEQFKSIMQNLPVSVIISDDKGNIQYVNPQFEAVSGYNFGELINKNPRVLKSGMHDHKFYENMWHTLEKGLTWEGEIYNRNKKGQLYLEKLMIFPYKDKYGQITNYIGLRIDDTDKRKAEALKHIKELAGGIAHEFSQPLQVITISLSMLESKLQKNEQISRIKRMINKIVELVNSLKNITELKQQEYLDIKILDLKASSLKKNDNKSRNRK